MGTSLEDLRILQDAEEVADGVWEQVVGWEVFAKEVVGGQLARAADSVGANIAEAFGRFHYGEKLRFLYYARGSLFETKYWLNRALKRGLLVSEQVQSYANQLTGIARQLNALANSIKAQRQGGSAQFNSVREIPVEYTLDTFIETPTFLFNDDELKWLQNIFVD